MKIQTTIILGIILAMSLISAVEVFAGNSYSFESEQFEYWGVVGNSSNMDGLNISWENGNTTINFDIRYKPDNFTLVFFDKETEVIVEHHYSGGGSCGGGGYLIEPKNETNQTTITSQDETEQEEVVDIQDKGISFIWIVLIILIIVGGVLLIIWWRNRE